MRDQLIAAIEADPDDIENYRVYADWLESNGQPRGQLIQLELLRARLTDRAKLDHLDRKIDAYVETHRKAFLGALKSWLSVRYSRNRHGELIWRYGFIHRAVISHYEEPAQRLRELIASASGRFVVELELRIDVLDALLERMPASLRALDIVVDEIDLSKRWPALAQLHRLGLHINTPTLGVIDLPGLRKLSITSHIVERLEPPVLPSLETLQFHDGPSAATILSFLDRLEAPVTKLVLEHVASADDIVGRLADTRIGRQLAEVTLPQSSYFTEDGVRRWLENPPPHKLARIDVRENRLSDQARAALRSIAREVVFTPRTYL